MLKKPKWWVLPILFGLVAVFFRGTALFDWALRFRLTNFQKLPLLSERAQTAEWERIAAARKRLAHGHEPWKDLAELIHLDVDGAAQISENAWLVSTHVGEFNRPSQLYEISTSPSVKTTELKNPFPTKIAKMQVLKRNPLVLLVDTLQSDPWRESIWTFDPQSGKTNFQCLGRRSEPSPDGKKFALTRGGLILDVLSIHVRDARSGKEQKLVSFDNPNTSSTVDYDFFWVDDTRLFISPFAAVYDDEEKRVFKIRP